MRCLVFILLAALINIGHANILRHTLSEGEAGQPPKGMFHSLSYDASTGRMLHPERVLEVNYKYGISLEGRPYVEVDLFNHADQSANYSLNLSSSPVPVISGEVYTLSLRLSSTVLRSPVVMNTGFQLYKKNGQYISEFVDDAGEYEGSLGGAQDVTSELVGASADRANGEQPDSALPRISVYNIPTHKAVRFRVSGIRLTRLPVGDVSLHSWSSIPAKVMRNQKLPLVVTLKGKSRKVSDEAVISRLVLRGAGDPIPLGTDHTQKNIDGHLVRDVWNEVLPFDLPVGTYDLWYELPRQSIKRKLGDIKVVSEGAGMLIGYSFHRYPGISEKYLGGIKVKYHFARSLASDLLYGVQWWVGPDDYDWTGLTRWAKFHSPHGERTLLMTFSGTPKWASSAPLERSAMGLLGYAAPPDRIYRSAYRRMVQATVERLRGRMLAVECWNEPNSPDFFTGTQKDLADLCKDVYVSSKLVDPSVPVICPQADDPSNLDFVYGAKTSEGESIFKYCDLVGSHIYNKLSFDAAGADYSQGRLSDGLRVIREMGLKYGIKKPIAITEFGVSSCVAKPTKKHPYRFGDMSSMLAGDALYRSLAEMRAFGVELVALYSYDLNPDNPKCLPGGSFIRMTEQGDGSRVRVNEEVVRRMNEAFIDFGVKK